jgi:Putative prokaryotic signal transducing protein
MRQVHTADNPTDAHFLKGLLEANGIAAQVRFEDMIGDYPSVWVTADTDFKLAQELISALSSKQEIVEAQSESKCCPRCGENIEYQFTECWQCGTSTVGFG